VQTTSPHTPVLLHLLPRSRVPGTEPAKPRPAQKNLRGPQHPSQLIQAAEGYLAARRSQDTAEAQWWSGSGSPASGANTLPFTTLSLRTLGMFIRLPSPPKFPRFLLHKFPLFTTSAAANMSTSNSNILSPPRKAMQ
jgi:hypothetical protein